MQLSVLTTSRRNLQTAKPLFTQIPRSNSRQTNYRFKNVKTSIGSRTLPNLHKGSLDTSKENISYEKYLTKVNSAAKIDQKAIVSSYLNSLRKQLDQMAKNSRQKQIEINRMKKQIQFMRRKNQSQKVMHHNFNEKVSNSSSDVRNIEDKHQNVKMESKILNHVINRMKKDQIWHKNALRIKDGQVCNNLKSVKQKQQLVLAQDQNLHKLHQHLNQMKNLYLKNQYEREKKYESYLQRIENLQQKQRFVQERQQRTYQLLSIESNDILDAKNVLGRQVLMVNKVCDSILEVRIFSLLKKYEHVQNAFHTIKTKTSISDPHLLANKFFSYDQLSQNLMKSIYTSELKLQAVSEQNKRLQTKYKEVAYREMMGDDSNEPQKVINILLAQQKKRTFTENIQRQILLKKIRLWIQKNFNLLGCHQLTGLDPVSMKFRAICSKLKQEIGLFEKKDQKITDRKYTTAGFRLKKMVKQVSIENQNIRKTEVQEMSESLQIENQYMLESRNIVKKAKQQSKSKGQIASVKSTQQSRKVENY